MHRVEEMKVATEGNAPLPLPVVEVTDTIEESEKVH